MCGVKAANRRLVFTRPSLSSVTAHRWRAVRISSQLHVLMLQSVMTATPARLMNA